MPYHSSNNDSDALKDDAPPVNPQPLCPWCDDPLPANPSEHLRTLMDTGRKRSSPNPSILNPDGLIASVSLMSAICHLHERETHREVNMVAYHAPPAGWPTVIDWKTFPERVLWIKEHLQRMINDIDEEWQRSNSPKRKVKPLDEDAHKLILRPRKENYFWKSITNDIIRHGFRHVDKIDGRMEIVYTTKPG